MGNQPVLLKILILILVIVLIIIEIASGKLTTAEGQTLAWVEMIIKIIVIIVIIILIWVQRRIERRR